MKREEDEAQSKSDLVQWVERWGIHNDCDSTPEKVASHLFYHLHKWQAENEALKQWKDGSNTGRMKGSLRYPTPVNASREFHSAFRQLLLEHKVCTDKLYDDYILANYVMTCLYAFDEAARMQAFYREEKEAK